MAQDTKDYEAVVLGGQSRDNIAQGPSHLHRIKHERATLTAPLGYLMYGTGQRTRGGLDHGREGREGSNGGLYAKTYQPKEP